MPTKPLETILYRELSIIDGKEVIDISCAVLQELVNYSTKVFARCATSTSDEEENIPVPLLYLHMVEMTDGIEVLLSKCCAVPAKPLLRSSFEALLSIEYILAEKYALRALSWLAFFMRKRLALYKSYDSSTTEGKDLHRLLSADKIAGDVELEYPPEFDDFILNYEERLASPKFEPVRDEIERYRQENNSRPKQWYQLSGPPPPQRAPWNLQQLAKHLERGGMYEVLYREWSSIQHAVAPSRFIATTDKETQAIRALRDPSQVATVADFAVTFMVNATRLVLQKFRPGEESSFSKWYVQEVRGFHQRLSL